MPAVWFCLHKSRLKGGNVPPFFVGLPVLAVTVYRAFSGTTAYILEVLCIKTKRRHFINDEIREATVRVIDADGAQLGVMPSKDALKMAYDKSLDLVKIAPQANPPVCRIMDYGKYCFEQAKKEKEARKNQKVVDVKEVQLSLKIEANDINTKAKNALRFLGEGDKVKVVVRFRGREMAHTEFGTALLARFAELCKDAGVVERTAKLEGRNMTMFLASKVGKPATN